MWVKWWYHANYQPFQSSFEMLFNFRVLYLKIISNAWKITNEVRKGWKLMMCLWMGHFEHRKLWSSNRFKKMKSLFNRRVSVWNPDTSNENVCFVHEVHPVFAVTLLLSRTCYVGEMMIPCQLGTFSEFISNAFQFHGLITQNNQ